MPINAFVVYEDIPIVDEESQKQIILAMKEPDFKLGNGNSYPFSLSSKIPLLGEGIFSLYNEAFSNHFRPNFDSTGYFFGGTHQFINAKKFITRGDGSKMKIGVYTICDQMDSVKLMKTFTVKFLDFFTDSYYSELLRFKEDEKFDINPNKDPISFIHSLNKQASVLGKLMEGEYNIRMREGKVRMDFYESMQSALKKLNPNRRGWSVRDLVEEPCSKHFYELLIYDKNTSSHLYSLCNGLISSVEDVDLKSGLTSSCAKMYEILFGEPLTFFGGGGYKVVLSSMSEELDSSEKIELKSVFICSEDDHQPFSIVYSQMLLDKFFEKYRGNHLPTFIKKGLVDKEKFQAFDKESIPILEDYAGNVSEVLKLSTELDQERIKKEMEALKSI